MKIQKKYIITGPAGSGKSTLIKGLEEEGFDCIEETARKIIIDQQNKGLDGIPWLNIERFVRLVFEKTKQELTENKESLFCDRSLIDFIAYLKDAEKEVPEDLIRFPFSDYYQKIVFFTPPWLDIYEKDKQRPQEFEEHLSLSQQLKNTYLEMGFQVIDLPFTTVEKRIEFVLKTLNLDMLHSKKQDSKTKNLKGYSR